MRSSRFVFAHRLTQDAAYSSLLATNSRALHSAAAEALLERHVPGGPDDEARRLALAQHLTAAQRHREAHDQYVALLSLRDTSGRLTGWDALAALAVLQWSLARERDSTLPEESTLLLICRGFHAQRLGRPQAGVPDLEQALRQARTAGDHAAEADVLSTLGYVAATGGRMTEALAYHQTAVQLTQTYGLTIAEVRARMLYGSALTDSGDEPAALEQFRTGLQLAEQVGNMRRAGILHVSIGAIQVKGGRYDEGRASYARALELLRATGDRLPEAITLGNLGTIEFESGNWDEARRYFEAARRMCLDLEELRTLGVWEGYLAVLAQQAGDATQAAGLIADAHAHAEAGGDIFAVGHVICSHAELELLAGRPAASAELVCQGEELAEAAGVGPGGELARKLARLRARLQ